MPTIRRCCIVGCMSNSRQNPQLQFFQFPKPDNPFYKLWTQACHASLSRILPFKKPVVCAMHFHPHCIGGRRLTGSAVPTLKLEVPSNLKAVEQQAMVEEIERSRKCAYINAVVYEWLVRANLDPQLRGSITHGMIKEKAETAKQIIGCDSFMADNRWLNRFRESHLTGFAQKLASNQLKPMGPSLWIPDIVQDLQNLFPPTSAERIESFENMPEQYMNYMKQYGEYDEEEEVGSEQSYGDHDQNYQQQQQQQQHQPHPHQQQHHTAHNYYNQHSGYDAYVQQQQQQHHQLAHHQAAGYNAYHDYYSQHHQQQQQQHQQHQHHQQHPPLHYPHHPGYGYHQHHSQQSPSRPMSRSPTQQATVSQHTAAGMAMSTSPSHSTSQRTSPYPASNSSNSNPAKRARSNEPETNEQSNGAIRTAFDSTNNAAEPMIEDLTESPDANNDNSNTRSHNDNANNIKNNGTSSSSNDSGNHSNDNNNDDRRNSFKIKLPLTQAVSNTGSPTRTPPPLQSSSSSKSAAAPTNGTSSGSTSPKSLNGTPPTQTNGHSSASPTPSTVTQIKEIETYTQALEYLKPLEDFALFKENFRAIGLISQLEMILRKGERSTMPSLTD